MIAVQSFNPMHTMNQLHKSYSNLQAWKIENIKGNNSICLVFDSRLSVYISLFIALSCAVMILVLRVRDLGEASGTIIWSVIAVGIAVPLGISTWAFLERRKGALMCYNTENDLLILPRINRRIELASKRVAFSFEHYSDLSDHFFELNLVLDGTRVALVSSSVKNGFDRVICGIEAMGFSITYNRIKL